MQTALTVNNYFDGIFCINLKKRPGRKQQAMDEFAKHNITVEFVEAIDGNDLGAILVTGADGTIPSPGDIGCTLSHLKVAQLAKERELRNYLVFEDDVELSADFTSDFAQVVKQLPLDWDMLYFGGNHAGGYISAAPNLVQVTKTYTTHAMAVNRHFFDKIIEVLGRRNDKVDVLIASLHATANCFCFMPHLAFQKPGFSDILNKQVDYPHLRNAASGNSSNIIYMPITMQADKIIRNHFDVAENLLLLEQELRLTLADINENPDAELTELFNSGKTIVFLTTFIDHRTADKVMYNFIKDAVLARIKGKAVFVTVNLLEYEFAEDKDRHFDINVNVILHNDSYDKFEKDIANRLLGYDHSKKYFPRLKPGSSILQEHRTVNNISTPQPLRNEPVNNYSSLFSVLRNGLLDYYEIIKNCHVDYKPITDYKIDLAVIIPVKGRRDYLKACLNYFKIALQKHHNVKLSEKHLKINVVFTVVENNEKPEHAGFCNQNGINYVWVPQQQNNEFNKSLCHNIGAISMQSATWLLFHDADILVPETFFDDLTKNYFNQSFDACQCFTGRRLLQANETITNSILNESQRYVISFHTKNIDGITTNQPGAAGGSILIKTEKFAKIGGFNDVLFVEYSLEDQHFFDKMQMCLDVGFCNNPAIELLHLHHPPAFNRTVRDEDKNAYVKWAELNQVQKNEFVKIEREHMQKFIRCVF